MSDALSPSPAVLAKLGSIAVHAEEMLSEDGHTFDREALLALLSDSDVVTWLQKMNEIALIPRKRK